MRTIIFRDLTDAQILDIVDSTIPYILIPGFRPRIAREWWTTDVQFGSNEKLENIEVRDFTVDILTDKKTVEKIFRRGQFNQLVLWQFNKRVPSTLKVDELPRETADAILIQNGLVNKIWINYEYVELSSADNNYIEAMKERFKEKMFDDYEKSKSK